MGVVPFEDGKLLTLERNKIDSELVNSKSNVNALESKTKALEEKLEGYTDEIKEFEKGKL